MNRLLILAATTALLAGCGSSADTLSSDARHDLARAYVEVHGDDCAGCSQAEEDAEHGLLAEGTWDDLPMGRYEAFRADQPCSWQRIDERWKVRAHGHGTSFVVNGADRAVQLTSKGCDFRLAEAVEA